MGACVVVCMVACEVGASVVKGVASPQITPPVFLPLLLHLAHVGHSPHFVPVSLPDLVHCCCVDPFGGGVAVGISSPQMTPSVFLPDLLHLMHVGHSLHLVPVSLPDLVH